MRPQSEAAAGIATGHVRLPKTGDYGGERFEHAVCRRVSVVFGRAFVPTVRAADVPAGMAELIRQREELFRQRTVHPLIALGAFNLDFLCVHPFRDGNGRVSRLLLLLDCYHAGLEVGRFISLERLIEQNKDRYYET
ncbi:MAG TPA: Fic family protein, partial [Pirellulales bacterium]